MKLVLTKDMVVSGRRFKIKISSFGKDDYCVNVVNDSELSPDQASHPIWIWYENESWHISEELSCDLSDLLIEQIELLRS
jgi:hypothetical protein